MGTALLLGLLLFQPDPKGLIQLYRQALAEREKEGGSQDPKTARGASDLGIYLRNLGERAESARLLARALAIDEQHFPAEHPVIAEDLENLASVSAPAQAVQLYRRAAVCAD